MDITIDAMSFTEGVETLDFTSVYSTDDDNEFSKFIIEVERFLKDNLQAGDYERLDAYSLDGFADDCRIMSFTKGMRVINVRYVYQMNLAVSRDMDIPNGKPE